MRLLQYAHQMNSQVKSLVLQDYSYFTLLYFSIKKRKNLQEGGNRYFFEHTHGSPSQLTPVQLCFPGVISVPSSSTHVRHQFLCVHNRVKSNKFTLNTLNLLSADSRENSETL